ncbi:hypothetical protein M0657_002032 [Pyricularia oryzae]|nr:hypothetical protein M9X92_001489 [Pyricularia oryzae]KAI7929555.1 hypothetical protein M0657_002032 [Pyricularia oryzae]
MRDHFEKLQDRILVVRSVLISGKRRESCSVNRSRVFSLVDSHRFPFFCRFSRLLFCVFENGLATSWKGVKRLSTKVDPDQPRCSMLWTLCASMKAQMLADVDDAVPEEARAATWVCSRKWISRGENIGAKEG